MPTLINPTYFQSGNLFISNNSNLNAEISGVPNSGSEIQLFIDIHERELLINALGIILYEQYESNSSETKWQELINGKTYTINEVGKRWDGLLGSNKQSLIAFYIYCQYLRNDQSTYTTTGVVKAKAANSEIVNPTEKYMYAFNQFITRYQGNHDQDCRLNSPNIIINCSGMVGLDYYKQSKGSFVDMYTYMTDQNTIDPTTFPDFQFKFYKRENSWGL